MLLNTGPLAKTVGRSTARQPAACDALRCTACDFGVLRIPRRRWKEDQIDYLFLRNYCPDLEKLAPMLQADELACAYACQCSWRNSSSLQKLKDLKDSDSLRWVCKGHTRY